MVKRKEIEAARNMEADCTVGAGAGFGKYTREVAERRRGQQGMTDAEKEEKRAVAERMFIARIFRLYPSLMMLWPFGWKSLDDVCLVIVKPDKVHARYMLPINNRHLRFQAAAAGLVRDGRRHETAMYWTGEGEEERDDAVLCIASAV